MLIGGPDPENNSPRVIDQPVAEELEPETETEQKIQEASPFIADEESWYGFESADEGRRGKKLQLCQTSRRIGTQKKVGARSENMGSW
ncbi:hypothetical protein NHQ30_004291 [Ciborinia camelliae]|nr:hypothetical protein NHQ30_004291 [Ciborinia camelliae]